MLVEMQDLDALSFCHGGARRWFALHGLNWAAFLRDGIPAETLARVNDPLANAAIEQAKKRHGLQ